MPKINFSPRDFKRSVAGDEMILRNRYFETNPVLSEDGASLLARPGLNYLTTVGSGPIRGIFQTPDFFDGDLFVASYDTLYRVSADLTSQTLIGGLVNPERGAVNMAATAPIGDTVPAYLFFADGAILYYYTDNGSAQGVISGTAANNDVVRIGSTYYQFTTGSVDAGTPAGTVGNPWLVQVDLVVPSNSWIHLAGAIGLTGTAGTNYSTATTINPDVIVAQLSATSVTVRAKVAGLLANSIVTTETGVGIGWGSGTLTGGGAAQVGQVPTPDDIGIFDVDTSSSFVICLPTQEDEYVGRFYWIDPGELFIDPLNFATAERSPDGVLGVEVLGDQFWLSGPDSTEVWYVSQDPINRMQRLQGVVFDRGTWEGTTVAIHETLIVCDANGAVFAIRGGSPKRISSPDIEEQIRLAISQQLAYEI